MTTPIIDYRSPAPPASTQPQLWVVFVLILQWCVGSMAAEFICPLLHQPGKDPQHEMGLAQLSGLLAMFSLVAVFRKRLWRLTIGYSLIAFAIGLLSVCAGIVRALIDRG